MLCRQPAASGGRARSAGRKKLPAAASGGAAAAAAAGDDKQRTVKDFFNVAKVKMTAAAVFQQLLDVGCAWLYTPFQFEGCTLHMRLCCVTNCH